MNKVEYYPYLTLYIYLLLGGLGAAVKIQNQPGIVVLGFIAIPLFVITIVANVRTYGELKNSDTPAPKVTHAFQYSPKGQANKTLLKIIWMVLIATIVISTYIHHFQPQVLNVPSNTDITTWQSPSFENTVIYDRVTDAERQRILTHGIPESSFLEMFLFDLAALFAGMLCLIHAFRHYGLWLTSCFFIGSFVFTGLQESLWILSGRLLSAVFTHPLGQTIHGSYWFTKGGLWFVETPFYTCISWFYLAYSIVLVVGKVYPGMNIWARAGFSGLLSVMSDIWMDPIATAPEFLRWIWAKGDFFLLLGIPLYNFLGWFLLIAVFAAIWEYLPQWEETWGRTKATVKFFYVCIIADMAIFPMIIVFWFAAAPKIALMIGHGHAIALPPGW